MKSNKLRLLILAALVVPLPVQAVPLVAVLDAVLAPGMDESVVVPVTDNIIEELAQSEKYRVIDHSNIEQALKEKEFRLSSGMVKAEEARQAGEYLGADLVVVANASRVGTFHVLTAEMIDVLIGEIVAQASAEQRGAVNVLLDAARVVGRQLTRPEVTEPAVARTEEAVETQPASDQASVPADCKSSFELGKLDAKNIPRRGWFWFGWGFASLCGIAGFFAGLGQGGEFPGEFPHEALIYSFAGSGIGTGISIFATLVFTPGPRVLPDESAVDRECYLDGYKSTAKVSNTASVLMGNLLGAGTAALAGVAIVAAAAVAVTVLIVWIVTNWH